MHSSGEVMAIPCLNAKLYAVSDIHTDHGTNSSWVCILAMGSSVTLTEVPTKTEVVLLTIHWWVKLTGRIGSPDAFSI